MRRPEHRDLARLDPKYARFELHSELHLGGCVLRFPHGEVNTRWQPREWLAIRHDAGKVHEPGMVAWLFALGEMVGELPVRFFDVGAAYGYFSLVASVAFRNCSVAAIEPNASLARYTALVGRANQMTDWEVENVLVSDRDGAGRFSVENFLIREVAAGGPSGKSEERIETRSLTGLLERHSPASSSETIDILKIDTEGWYARFLPPAASTLIERGAILLLECDSPAKLADFGVSNADVATPFLEAGYQLYWCDHRDPRFEVVRLDRLDHAQERNGLLALIPERYRIA